MPIPSTFENVPHGAAGFHLLGKLYQMTNRHANAIVAFSTALKLDPMMWCAFEELCVLGAESETRQYVGDADGIVAEPGSQEEGHVDNNNSNKPPSSLSGVTPPTTAGFMTMTNLPTSAAAATTNGGGTGPPLPISMSPVGEQAQSSSAVPTTQYPIIHGFAATGFTTAAAAATAPTTATVGLHTGNTTVNRNLPASTLGVGGMPLVTPSPGTAAFITPQGGAGFPSGPPPPPVAPKAGAGSNNNLPSNYSWPHATTPNAVPTFASSTGGGSTGGGEKRKFDDGGNPRKVSSKLFADPASVLKRMALLPEAIGTELDQRALAVLAATNIAHAHRNPKGQHQALNILRAIGAGFQAMAFYQC